MGRHFCFQAGMTLLELLVTIMIIGILAAIAIPSYNVHLDRVRMTETQNLLDNLAIAIEAYHTTNKEYPPCGSDTLRRALLGLPPFSAVAQAYGDIPTKNIAPSGWMYSGAALLKYYPNGNQADEGVYCLDRNSEPWTGLGDSSARPILDAWGRPVIYIRDLILKSKFRKICGKTDYAIRGEWAGERNFELMVAFTDQKSYPDGNNKSGASTYNLPYHMNSFQLYSFGSDGYTNESDYNQSSSNLGPGTLIWDNHVDDDGDGRTDYGDDRKQNSSAGPRYEDDVINH